MSGGSSLLRPGTKSNTELVASLRSNFASAQQSVPSPPPDDSQPAAPSYQQWTSKTNDQLQVPALDFESSGLLEEPATYSITVKLFFLPNVPTADRCAQIRKAIDLVLKELHAPSIDLLIVSFPGISFNASEETDSTNEDDGDDGDSISERNSARASSTDPAPSLLDTDGDGPPEQMSSILQTWQTLESLHDSGTVRALGLAEFGSRRLAELLAAARVRPHVNQINVTDCCVVPERLLAFAKRESIELLTHSDCTNILPRGTVRTLLGPAEERGAGVLAGKDAAQGKGSGLVGEVEPQWVVKYTAVVRDRGVVENKGYFAGALLVNG